VAIAYTLSMNANTDGSLRMDKEELLKLPMVTCQYCGWEIGRGHWHNTFNGKPICDDCVMDMVIQHNKDEGITV